MTSFLSGAGKLQRAGSLQLWRFCCCVWSARIVFNRSRVCERSFLSFSVSRLFSAYNLWKLPANVAERFVTFDIREEEKFIDNEQNNNTRKKTKNDMALLSSFMAKEKENRQVEEIPPQELDNYLSRFLLSVRKKNGDEYEPSTLRGFIASIECYLKKCRYSESVITGQNFARTRDTLKSKQKHLKRLGKGNKPNEASSLTPEERDILFERKEMGFSSPKTLINTLWLNNCMHFGLRGGKEQRELKWGDVVLKGQSFWKGIPRILYRKANQDTAWR